MTIIDTTDSSQTDAISFEVDLPQPPSKVWRALTDPELLTEWLLPVTGFKPVVGQAFTFQTQPFPGWDGKVACRIREVDALKSISYNWVVGDMVLNTIVTFTLTPTAGGTHLTVVQSGFKPDQKQNFGGARYGWKMMGQKLIDVLGRLS